MTENDVQQKVMLYQLLLAQLEELKKQAESIQARYMELEASRLALEDIKKAKEGSETLIPLGSGIFIDGKIKKGDVLMNVGAGVLARRPIADVSKDLETKKEELEGFSNKLQEEMVGTINKINEIGGQLEKEMK